MRPLIPPPYSSTLYKSKTPYGYNTVHYSIYGRITAVRQPHCRYLTVALLFLFLAGGGGGLKGLLTIVVKRGYNYSSD